MAVSPSAPTACELSRLLPQPCSARPDTNAVRPSPCTSFHPNPPASSARPRESRAPATVSLSRSSFKGGLQTYAKPLLLKALQLKPCRRGGRSFALQSRVDPSPGLLARSGCADTGLGPGNSSLAKHKAFPDPGEALGSRGCAVSGQAAHACASRLLPRAAPGKRRTKTTGLYCSGTPNPSCALTIRLITGQRRFCCWAPRGSGQLRPKDEPCHSGDTSNGTAPANATRFTTCKQATP